MPHARPWRFPEILTAAILFFASAAFTLWQNTRVAVLWDLSYLLDTSYRISLGQVPYRDFPFAHAPLTFLLHAAIIHLFGRIYFPHIVCAALEAGAATIFTWRILLHIFVPTLAQPRPLNRNKKPDTEEDAVIGDRGVILAQPESPSLNRPATTLRPQVTAIVLALPLTVLGIYAIYPHPIYDGDCILAVLAGLYLLRRAADGGRQNTTAGAVCALPLFFKQNIGLPFLFVTLACAALVAIVRRTQRMSMAPQTCFFAGVAAALGASLLAIHLTAGLHNYLYWTIAFAAERRLPGLSLILATYRQTSLLWTMPLACAGFVLLRSPNPHNRTWQRPAAFLLLAAPFLWTIMRLALTSDCDDRADQLLSLWPHILLLAAALALYNLRPQTVLAHLNVGHFLPLILLATIHGAFLSQQLWGSTYSIWPLLMLLVATLLAQTSAIARPLAVTISVTLLLCGGLYATSHERLAYIHLEEDLQANVTRATLPQLHGLSTPGAYIPAFEELVGFANNEIPPNDGILLLPGEDPFYFATGRAPQFPILLFDPATDPYNPQQTLTQARAHNIRWLIVTRNLQLTEPPRPDLPVILKKLQQDFVPYRTLANYDIYRRR